MRVSSIDTYRQPIPLAPPAEEVSAVYAEIPAIFQRPRIKFQSGTVSRRVVEARAFHLLENFAQQELSRLAQIDGYLRQSAGRRGCNSGAGDPAPPALRSKPRWRFRRFDICSFEIQLTSHNDGEYYKWHTDNGTLDTATRVITFVYYFYGQPKKFSGGELIIYQPDEEPAVIDPANDSVVFFRSHTRHEVKAVTCPSQQFEDGRFTLNGWIRRKETVLRDDYFDARIFGPLPEIGKPRPFRRGPLRRVTETHYTRSPTRPAAFNLDTPAATDDIPLSRESATSIALLNLYSELYRQSRRAGLVDVVCNISRNEFYENYYCLNRPVVLKDMAGSSPALRKWSPEFFARNYGSVTIQITSNREGVSDYEANFQRTTRTVTIAEFVNRLSDQDETNDFYLVARNYFFENPALAGLREDLSPPPEIINVADRGPGTAKLWFGPKGTVTPLHHDEHSILFLQIYGRKQFKLIPSFELPKIYLRKNFYSAVDLENIDAERYPKFIASHGRRCNRRARRHTLPPRWLVALGQIS